MTSLVYLMAMPSYGQMPEEKTFDNQMMEKSLKVDTSLQGAKDGQQARKHTWSSPEQHEWTAREES
jgi:hypothetical protein